MNFFIIYIFIFIGYYLAIVIFVQVVNFFIEQRRVNSLPQEKKCELFEYDLHLWRDSGAIEDESTYVFHRDQKCSYCGRISRLTTFLNTFSIDGAPISQNSRTIFY